MSVWRILGRSHFLPPPDGWRAALTQRLGQRPRRIGSWAELASFGALACLDDAGEAALPNAALLSVSSLLGPDTALQAALASARTELPMPIGFLQSQPGQVLPVLAQHLGGWSGNGRCLSTRDPLLALRLACLEASAGGVLLGWVDEGPDAKSLWLRVVTAPSGAPFPACPAGFDELFTDAVRDFSFATNDAILIA